MSKTAKLATHTVTAVNMHTFIHIKDTHAERNKQEHTPYFNTHTHTHTQSPDWPTHVTSQLLSAPVWQLGGMSESAAALQQQHAQRTLVTFNVLNIDPNT